jgi:hypothetical protein
MVETARETAASLVLDLVPRGMDQGMRPLQLLDATTGAPLGSPYDNYRVTSLRRLWTPLSRNKSTPMPIDRAAVGSGITLVLDTSSNA